LSQNTFQFFGMPIMSIGNIYAAAEKDGLEDVVLDENGVYRRAVLKDGRLIWILSVRDIKRFGLFAGVVRSGIKVNSIKDRLVGNAFGFTDLPKEFRQEMLTKPG
ncbi:MAG TPA: hypothetical protein VII00_01775, partial [bacterium]